MSITRTYYLVSFFFSLVALTSCHTEKKILYMQNASLAQTIKMNRNSIVRIQQEDKLNIIVTSKNPELSRLFNKMSLSQYGESTMQISMTSSSIGSKSSVGRYNIPYRVNSDGNIDYPILGTLHVEGLTRDELQSLIMTKLKQAKLLMDSIVTVSFLNHSINVLGEVNKPGRIGFDKDRYTILDAIADAGDLTLLGRRDSVLITRIENNTRTTYTIDLRNINSIFNSPIYYMQQNDVVYVKPNKKRIGESTINGNNIKSISVWMSLTSLLLSLGTILLR